MSVVVRMEMPKACWSCGLRFVCKAAYDFMTTKEPSGYSVLKVGMEGCMIVCQLPEGHGDLIDRDTFISKYLSYYTKQEREFNLMFAAVEVKQQFADMICDEQAIVPVERSET